MLTDLMSGLMLVLHPHVLMALAGATVIGYVIGAMPGLGPSLGVALLIPFTYGVDPVVAMIALISLYVAAEYGGAITAILLNTPGTAAAVATAWDGYPMAKRGEADFALHVSIISSGVAAFVGALMLIATAVPLSEFALKFGPTEYCALAVFGLSLVSNLGGNSVLRSLLAMAIGVVFACVGMDPENGTPRFALTPDFFDGIPLVPALLGMYAISEALMMIEGNATQALNAQVGKVTSISMKRYRGLWGCMLRSTVIGYLVGVIPGAGASIASLIAYHEAKRTSPAPETFGQGNPAGVAASEAANNSAVPGALAPLLALGIPGSPTAAILIGALMIQGIQPGPLLFVRNPEIPYSIFASLLIGVPLMVAVGLFGAKLWVQAVRIPSAMLIPLIVGIALVGAYASENSMFPVYVTLFFGVLGYLFRKLDIPLAPIVLALVLTPMAETNYRQALVIANGDHVIFLTHPITVGLLACAAASFVVPVLRRRKAAKAGRRVGLE